MGIYFLTAFYLEWIPGQLSWNLVSFVVIGILSFVAIWTAFYLYNKNEAKKWNQRLKEMEQEEKS